MPGSTGSRGRLLFIGAACLLAVTAMVTLAKQEATNAAEGADLGARADETRSASVAATGNHWSPRDVFAMPDEDGDRVPDHPARKPADGSDDGPPGAAFERARTHLAASFDRQQRDEAWAVPEENRLRAFFGEHPAALDSELADVECRATLCRLNVVHADGDALHRFTAAAGLTPPFDVAGARFPVPPSGSEVYLAKRGTPLEGLQPPRTASVVDAEESKDP